jgi:hypothetical protein
MFEKGKINIGLLILFHLRKYSVVRRVLKGKTITSGINEYTVFRKLILFVVKRKVSGHEDNR